MFFKKIFHRFKTWLLGLSFRTGLIVLLLCVPFYLFSFLQMLLPYSVATKGLVWTICYGLAKTFQWGGLLILGPKGVSRIKRFIKKKRMKHSIKQIKLFIFDFDGTIGDSKDLIVKTMCQTIDEVGLPKPTPEACAATIGLPLRQCFEALLPNNLDKVDICTDLYHDLFIANNVPGAVKPFPNVIDTIKQLHQNGYKISIASNRGHNSLAKFIDDMELQKEIPILIGADDVKTPKPHTEAVDKICSYFNLDASQAIVVGDSQYDIQMGHAAGALTCAVTYGNGTKEELKSSKPDFIIDDFSALAYYFL